MINTNSALNLYQSLALQQSQRILSLADLDNTSDTFGCFDRYYWHYRQIDFANARFQEAALFLALIYSVNTENNHFYQNNQNNQTKNLISATINFWKNIQNSDGSFNEKMPYDRSYEASVFSTYSIVQTCLLMKLESPKQSIQKAIDWMINNKKLATPLQKTYASLTLTLANTLNHEEKLIEIGNNWIEEVYKKHSELIPTCDTGQLTLILSALGQLKQHNNTSILDEFIIKITDQLKKRITHNGIINDNSADRSANIVYPLGLLLTGEEELINIHIKALEENKAIRPSWLDDMTIIPLTINYLQTHFY